MKFIKNFSLITLFVFCIFFILETFFYFGRVYLNKSSVGFLYNHNKNLKSKIKDDCQRMKTHPLLNYIHYHKNKCKVLGSSKYDDYFIWYKKKSSQVKTKLVILTLGGSTTDGFYQYISEGYTWPYYLQKICEVKFDCQVINGGTGGYSTTQELFKLISYNHLIPKIDYVISLNGINDIRTSRRTSGLNFQLHPYLSKIQYAMLEDQKWIIQHKVGFSFFPNIMSYINYIKFHNDKINSTSLLNKEKNNKNEEIKLIDDLKNYSIIWEQNINFMYNISRTIDAKFLSFLQPTMGLKNVKVKSGLITNDIKMLKKYKNSNLNKETNAFYEIIRIKCGNIKFCHDISYIAPPGDNLFNDPRHHNSKGNKIIANAIFMKILENFYQ